MYYPEGKKFSVTSIHALTDVSGCIRYAGQIDSNKNNYVQGKRFGHGLIEEGMFKDHILIYGRRWELNDDGSYQYYQVTQGEKKLVGKVPQLPGSQK